MNQESAAAHTEALERLLKRVRAVGGLGHPAVQESLDELHAALAGWELTLELEGTTVRSGGAQVWAASGDEPPVLASTHRDGVRKLVFLGSLSRDELAALVEALARAARRARSASFSAATLLGERLWSGLRWAAQDGALRGGAPEATEAVPEEWFFGEPIPALDASAPLPPPRKHRGA